MKEGQLRVWHIPQVPAPPMFYVDVSSSEEAKKVLNILWDYDNFQFENKIKPDFSNASGLEIYENNEWCEWNDDLGDDICEVMRNEEEE
jgi:hypothetical protein